jgi:hypothetical protein
MRTNMRHTCGSRPRYLAHGALLGLVCLVQGLAAAATLPASPCISGVGTTSCELWATTGSFTPPDGGASLTIWGYSASSGGGTASLPGPVLIATQGDAVTVTLTNNLEKATALLFQGQVMVPDMSGAAANGGTKTYTFKASNPGTYLYEAGLLPNAQHQVAMGMYGALVVRPATAGQAYGAATAFDDEALVVLGEIDPALNNSADPTLFDMRDFSPQYRLINGKSYPDTDPIPIDFSIVTGDHKLLLRYINAGILHHSIGLLGLSQTLVANDGSPLTYPHGVVAETIPPGATLDALTTVRAPVAPATAAARYALYDASLLLHNSNAPGIGGILTFIGGPAGASDKGPATTGVTLSPNPTNGAVPVGLGATITADSGLTVSAAEYFIDVIGADGGGIAMLGSFGSNASSVSATLSTASLSALISGQHRIYVHGQDNSSPTPKWGPTNFGVLNLDKTGPVTSGLTLTPNPSNGSVLVALHATGNDSTAGGSNVVAAEYFIGAVGANGTGTPMTINATAPVASLDKTIPPPVTGSVISVHSKDALGNWGALATITLNVVTIGPVTTAVSAEKSPNNGALPLSASQPVMRVAATMTSTGSTVSAAEGFIDTLGAPGTGFPFVPSDGAWDGASETGYADIPLATINILPVGNHTLHVRGRDAVGNWGVTSTVVILIDKMAPTFTGISLTPNPTLGAATVTLAVNGAVDPLVASLASGLAGGEYWIGTTAPAPAGGTPFAGLTASIPVGALATGTYTIGARIRDAAGNWSTGTSTATLSVVPDAIFSNGFETGNRPWGWSSASTNATNRLNVTTAPALVGTRSLQTQGNNTNYVQYNFGTTTNPASATFDARFYFRPNGNTSTGKDIFSAATSSGFGTTLFRVRYRLNGTTPQVQIQVGTTNTNTTWANINGGAANNVIELVWQAVGSGGPNPGILVLYVNGVSSQTLTTTSTGSVAAVRLGSVTNTGNATLMYFDAFASKRTVAPFIGP